jgi:acyl carrier protein
MSPLVETYESIQATVTRFVEGEVVTDREDGHVGPTDPLFNGLLDSLDTLRLIVFLEETFGVQIADGELVPENFESVARIADYVRRKAQG